jgi:hypothetical protein
MHRLVSLVGGLVGVEARDGGHQRRLIGRLWQHQGLGSDADPLGEALFGANVVDARGVLTDAYEHQPRRVR